MFGDILGIESPSYEKVRSYIDTYPSGKAIEAKHISDKTGVSLRAVRNYLLEMKKAGYLDVFSNGYLKGKRVCNTLYIKN